mgnify:CR=1 FL=1
MPRNLSIWRGGGIGVHRSWTLSRKGVGIVLGSNAPADVPFGAAFGGASVERRFSACRTRQALPFLPPRRFRRGGRKGGVLCNTLNINLLLHRRKVGGGREFLSGPGLAGPRPERYDTWRSRCAELVRVGAPCRFGTNQPTHLCKLTLKTQHTVDGQTGCVDSDELDAPTKTATPHLAWGERCSPAIECPTPSPSPRRRRARRRRGEGVGGCAFSL